MIENDLQQLQKQLEASCERYEHFLIIRDFNADVCDPSMTSFCTLFKLKNMKEPTCYKNPENPSCIDLFLTNCPRSFHDTCLYETGFSDFHKLELFCRPVLNLCLLKSSNTEIANILMHINSNVNSKNV